MENEKLEFGTIGGTTISGILGCSPYLSPLGAYFKIRREAPITEKSVAIERGLRFEDVVANTFAATHYDIRVERNIDFTEEPCRLVDKEIPYLTGSPDRLLFDKDAKAGDAPIAGLEIKTAGVHSKEQWGKKGTDQIPINYLCQCQWYLMFFPELTDWHVAVQFFDDNETPLWYAEYLIKRDDEVIQAMRKAAITFYEENVVKGIQPLSDSVDDCVRTYVRKSFPEDLGTTAVANSEENELVREYLEVRQEKERIDQRYEALKTRLQLAMKDNSYFDTAYGQISWKKTRDKEVIDYKSLCEFLHPKAEVVERFKVVKDGYRLFSDKGLKNNE